ncbi:MAG: hypothetical protein KatS3mg054_0299 [Chloroflexus sp.]|nr:MAG: hypothetical protein KatS3mg054_0299 [Chloroflexus sp.]
MEVKVRNANIAVGLCLALGRKSREHCMGECRIQGGEGHRGLVEQRLAPDFCNGFRHVCAGKQRTRSVSCLERRERLFLPSF